jgi:deoxyribonuclease-4
MIRYGYSGLPPDNVSDEEFLDGLVERGHDAFELAFVKEFPWKEKRCADFAVKADERAIALSAHAPYFAVLTVQDQSKAIQCRAAIEHTVKLGAELNARVIVAYLGALRDETPDEVMPRIREHLEWIGSKIEHLGVAVGLETAGKTTQIGSLGDIALLANDFPFVRPCVDWAHVHAVTQGQMTSVEEFSTVIGFLRDNFPGWMLDPLHTQFSDVEYGAVGEIATLGMGKARSR